MKSIVTPFDVCGSVDYNKLIDEFGTEVISKELIDRFERITGQACHHFIRRGIVFSHRSFDEILTLAENKKPFYLYTGRGPSSKSIHLGHLVPFMLTKYLSDIFQVSVVIQITDDEKCLTKDISLNDCKNMALENIKDIIACGFDVKRTFIFRNTDYIKSLYPNIIQIQKLVPLDRCQKIFGFISSDNIGKYAYPALQIAPSLSSSMPEIFGSNKYPCLIPCAIDQDPFFRLARDIAPRLKFPKPAVIHSKFLPSLSGVDTKMSSSTPNSTIFLSDTLEVLQKKISSFAFSGGQDTLEKHRQNGGNPDIDVSFRYLVFFEPDDDKLSQYSIEYKNGSLLSGELKSHLINLLNPIISEFQTKRSQITLQIVESFMTPRPLI